MTMEKRKEETRRVLLEALKAYEKPRCGESENDPELHEALLGVLQRYPQNYGMRCGTMVGVNK